MIISLKAFSVFLNPPEISEPEGELSHMYRAFVIVSMRESIAAYIQSMRLNMHSFMKMGNLINGERHRTRTAVGRGAHFPQLWNTWTTMTFNGLSLRKTKTGTFRISYLMNIPNSKLIQNPEEENCILHPLPILWLFSFNPPQTMISLELGPTLIAPAVHPSPPSVNMCAFSTCACSHRSFS